MSEASSTRSSSLWILVALAAFGLAFGTGHLVGGMDSSKVSGGPLTDGRRYKVPVSIAQPKRGGAEALVTIVEWCDLGGKACLESEAVSSQLLEEYGGNLRHAWRHFVTDNRSSDSQSLHEFARIVMEGHGKFWEVRELIMARKGGAVSRAELESYANKVGIDWRAIERELDRHTHNAYVGADLMFAQRFGVTETPTYYVNGRRLFAPVTKERLKALIDQEMAHAKKVKAETGLTGSKLYDAITKDGKFEPPLAAATLAKSP